MFLWRQRACFQRSLPLLISSSFHKIPFWCLNGCCVSVETQRKHLLKCLAHFTALSSHERNLGEMGPGLGRGARSPKVWQRVSSGFEREVESLPFHSGCRELWRGRAEHKAAESQGDSAAKSLQRSQVGSCTSGMKEAARGLF